MKETGEPTIRLAGNQTVEWRVVDDPKSKTHGSCSLAEWPLLLECCCRRKQTSAGGSSRFQRSQLAQRMSAGFKF